MDIKYKLKKVLKCFVVVSLFKSLNFKMNSSTRVIVNTIAQYVKTFVNIILTLFSARLILEALGVIDFGLYSLLAGVTSMLAFATNALASTTQRFLSYHQGNSHIEKQKDIFANSFYIQLTLGLLTLTFLLMLTPFLFDGILNVPTERQNAAQWAYVIVAVILFVTFLCTPYRAILISHENIVYITFIDVIDGLLKVGLAVTLFHIGYDRLIGYSFFLLSIQLFNLMAIAIYAMKKYEECSIPSVKRIRKTYIRDISSYAGWNIFSVGCVMGRTQGIAILINRFFGTAVNAAYGLGFQIAGYVNFMSESLMNALRPQIVRAEGECNRKKMLWLSVLACKFSFYLLSCLAIPCIFEMDTLLTLWLGKVPEYAVLFCRMVLIASIVDSLTCGLGMANQAIGNIKQYSIAVYIPKLLTLPVSFLFVRLGLPIYWIAVLYIVFEFVSAIIRLPFLKVTGGLCVSSFVKNFFCRAIVPFMILLITASLCSHYLLHKFSFVITFVVSVSIYIIAIYLMGLTRIEKDIINGILLSLSSKIKNKES